MNTEPIEKHTYVGGHKIAFLEQGQGSPVILIHGIPTIADELKTLPHPTLVIWGEHDPFQKPEYAPKLAATIPGAELVWIKNAGHWLIDEKPDEVAGCLKTFLG